MKNKKGTILDVLFIIVIIFTCALVAVMVLRPWNQIKEELEPHLSDEGVNAMNTADVFIQGYDNIIVFFFVGFLIAAIIGAFMIDTHPVFFFISVLLLIVTGFVGMQFANVWGQVAEVPALSTEVATYSKTDFLMRNLPLVSILSAAIVMIVLYVKSQYMFSGGV